MKLKRLIVFLIRSIFNIIFFVVLCIFFINLFVHIESSLYIYKNVETSKEAQTVLIPGAALLKSGEISPIFKDRVDVAIELYNAKKVSKILVSGDNSTVNHNEVNPVRTYLLGKGVPDEDIFLDHAGFDTYSSMYRAKEVFKVTSLIISTQSFHLPRAVFIGRMLGMQTYGISADKGNVLFKNYVREVFADEKAVLDLVFHIQPKYLGEPIPIEGDGRNFP